MTADQAKSAKAREEETTGAWIVHHGRKLQGDQAGSSEFPNLDVAAKAGQLLARMAASDEFELSKGEVTALARAARLNPKSELPYALEILEGRQLIDLAQNGSVSVLGVSSRKALRETAVIFEQLSPLPEEHLAIDVAESASIAPRLASNESKRIAEQFDLSVSDSRDFLRRARAIGFVDGENDGQDEIIFNGNLFRRDGIKKANKILETLNSGESARVAEVTGTLSTAGCLEASAVRNTLGDELFEKLKAASFFDVSGLANDQGEHAFVTLPSAFHKFVDPMVDDAFDMAKALVAALTYGISKSHPGRGKITMPAVLIKKLLQGGWVGAATAIGQDYKILEFNRVVQLRPADSGKFYMRLLKRDVGELALQVLTQGSSTPDQVFGIASASVSDYVAPEESRARLRRTQSSPSKRHTAQLLQKLREQGGSL